MVAEGPLVGSASRQPVAGGGLTVFGPKPRDLPISQWSRGVRLRLASPIGKRETCC